MPPIDTLSGRPRPRTQQADLMGEHLAREAEAAAPLARALGVDLSEQSVSFIRAVRDVARERAQAEREAAQIKPSKRLNVQPSKRPDLGPGVVPQPPGAGPAIQKVIAHPVTDRKGFKLLSKHEWARQNYPEVTKPSRKTLPQQLRDDLLREYQNYVTNAIAIERLRQGERQPDSMETLQANVISELRGKGLSAAETYAQVLALKRSKPQRDPMEDLQAEAIEEMRAGGASATQAYERLLALKKLDGRGGQPSKEDKLIADMIKEQTAKGASPTQIYQMQKVPSKAMLPRMGKERQEMMTGPPGVPQLGFNWKVANYPVGGWLEMYNTFGQLGGTITPADREINQERLHAMVPSPELILKGGKIQMNKNVKRKLTPAERDILLEYALTPEQKEDLRRQRQRGG